MSTCYYPLRILRDSENKIIFTNDGIPSLPCGQCLGCRLNHAESWAIRMVHESRGHDENSFLTLTYNDEHLPVHNNLDYRALTLFIKRLRKALSYTPYKNKVKYYAVGEYGEKFSRPHYHVILFGFDFSYKLRYKGIENHLTDEYQKNGKLYREYSFLNDLWSMGKCNVGDVNYNTCMYVAKYVTKKVNGRNKDSHYTKLLSDGELVEYTPEKSYMSRKNAIGKEWLTRFWSDVYPHDHVIHEARRFKVPKYYDKWLEKNDPSLYEQIKLEREDSMATLATRSQADLTRIHNVKYLNSQQSAREMEGAAPTNLIDEQILSYSKREQTTLHFKRKKNET